MTAHHEACIAILAIDFIRSRMTNHRHLVDWALAILIAGFTLCLVFSLRIGSKLKPKTKGK